LQQDELKDLIAETLDADLPDLKQLINHSIIEFTEEGFMSRENLIRFLDLRWRFNGALALQDLFLQKRQQALSMEDIELYKQYVTVFESAIEERLFTNYSLLIEAAQISVEVVDQSQDLHF